MPAQPTDVALDENRKNITTFTLQGYSRGLTAGLAGAATLAVFFFIADLAQGLALRTPAELGSVVFRGEMLPAATAVEPVLVAGYTVLHGGAFVALGILATLMVQTFARPEVKPLRLGVVLSGVFFLAFQAFILGMFALFEPGSSSQLGVVEVSVANLLAAVVMGGLIARN